MDFNTTYITLEEANAYFIATGNIEWSGEDFTDEQRKASLVKATNFIDAIGAGKWKGKKTKPDQPNAFPRTGVTDADGYPIDPLSIPYNLKKATAEAAFRYLNGADLLPDLQNVKKEAVVGAVSVEYTEQGQTSPKYQLIFSLLSDYVTSDLNNSTVECVVTRGFANGSL